MTNKPVLLLDIDGVLNVFPTYPEVYPENLKAPTTTLKKSYATDGKDNYPVKYHPDVIDSLRSFIAKDLAEVTWCTTWCDYVEQFEKMWDLPELLKAFRGVDPEDVFRAKRAVAEKVVASGLRLIWIDDEIGLFGGLEIDLKYKIDSGLLKTYPKQIYTISPEPDFGLQVEDFTKIANFCLE